MGTSEIYNLKVSAPDTEKRTDAELRIESAHERCDLEAADLYISTLGKKYGKTERASVSHEAGALERTAQSMNGRFVVISPCILERMTRSTTAAAYYENQIDRFFAQHAGARASRTRREQTRIPCGVVIHDDGCVTGVLIDTSASEARYCFERQRNITHLPSASQTGAHCETGTAVNGVLSELADAACTVSLRLPEQSI